MLVPVGSVYAAIGTELYYDDDEMDSSMPIFGDNGFVAVRFTPPSVPVKIVQMSFYSELQSPESTLGARVLIFGDAKEIIYEGSLFTSWNAGWNYVDLSSDEIQITEGDFYAGFEMPKSGTINFGLDEDPVIDGRSYFGFERMSGYLDVPTTDFDIMVRATVVPLDFGPENDNFPGTIISGESGYAMASNVDATLETDEPYHGFGSGEHTVWWSWTAPSDGTVAFDTYGSMVGEIDNLDTIITVYTGNSINELTLVAKNDDFDVSGGYQSQLAFKAVQGTTYRIVSDGYGGSDVGEIHLNWSYVTPEVGDDFSGTIISGLSGQDTKSNVYATKELFEPIHSLNENYEGQSSLWWTWTAPETGRFTFDTVGSTEYYDHGYSYLDTVMAIYTGDDIGELVLEEMSVYDQSQPASIDFMAIGGTTYRIAVDGQTSYYNALGNIVLNWYQIEAPTITSADHTTFEVGIESSFEITATGSPEPLISFDGYLPEGVIFDESTDTLKGTPVAGTGGSYPFQFIASNGIEPSDVQNFTLIVNQAPKINSAAFTRFKVGQEGNFTIIATGYPNPSLSITSGTLPMGVTLDSITGILSGTPIDGTEGSYPLVITAANGVDPDAIQDFLLEVILEMAPVITSQPESTTVIVGETATFTVGYTAYPEPGFQWQMSRDGTKWSNIADATQVSYSIPSTRLNMNGYQYRVLLNNYIGGQVISDAAVLTVISGGATTIADVSIDKQDGTYNTGNGNITWEITVSNNGESTAEGVMVTETLAKGTKFVAIDLSGAGNATYKVKGNAVDINIGQLAGNSSVNFTITSAVVRTISPVLNTATVKTTSYDPNLANNTDSAICSW
jgi:uncharacterized repeat protein (TIGR01451 family)